MEILLCSSARLHSLEVTSLSCTCVHATYVCVSKFCLVFLNYYVGQSLITLNFTDYLFIRNEMFPFP